MCEILHGYNPLAMHQTMSTWGMICTPKEWKTPSSYSSVRHLQGKRYSTMLAGIPGPGFLIFRAGRVIEVPRTPLEAIAVATGISRRYLRISIYRYSENSTVRCCTETVCPHMCQVNTHMEVMCMDPMTLPCADCAVTQLPVSLRFSTLSLAE